MMLLWLSPFFVHCWFLLEVSHINYCVLYLLISLGNTLDLQTNRGVVLWLLLCEDLLIYI